jgi:hypothetical protein
LRKTSRGCRSSPLTSLRYKWIMWIGSLEKPDVLDLLVRGHMQAATARLQGAFTRKAFHLRVVCVPMRQWSTGRSRVFYSVSIHRL